jgi:hypothetical protein
MQSNKQIIQIKTPLGNQNPKFQTQIIYTDHFLRKNFQKLGYITPPPSGETKPYLAKVSVRGNLKKHHTTTI